MRSIRQRLGVSSANLVSVASDDQLHWIVLDAHRWRRVETHQMYQSEDAYFELWTCAHEDRAKCLSVVPIPRELQGHQARVRFQLIRLWADLCHYDYVRNIVALKASMKIQL